MDTPSKTLATWDTQDIAVVIIKRIEASTRYNSKVVMELALQRKSL